MFDEETFEIPKFLQRIKASGLFSQKKLIVVKNIPASTLKELKLEEIKTDNVIIFYFSYDLKKHNKFCKNLLQEKTVRHFPLLNNFDLKKWMQEKIKKASAEIEPQALNLLSASVGNNLWQMTAELDKLIAYADGRITQAQVQTLVPVKINDDIFALVDAISVKNKKRALQLFEDQLKLGQDAFYLLAMIIRQFRLLVQVKSWLSQNKSMSHSQDRRMASELKMHPYVAKKTLSQAQGFTGLDLKKAYERLLKIDHKLKTTKIKPEVLLERMITA